MRRPNFNSGWTLALMCLALSGCRHRHAALPVVLAQTAPEIPLDQTAPQTPPPMVAPQKPPAPPPVVAKTPPRKARPTRNPAPPDAAKTAPPAPAPIQVASAGPVPETSAIGALSAGGDAAPQTQQQAADVIQTVQKRLEGLSQKTREEQRAAIEKIRRFLTQAQDALKSGDAEGAKTLATKASLLLDDLPK